MVRKLVYLALLTLVIVSCGTSYENSENQKSEEIIQTVGVTVLDFETKAGDLIGKPVEITATVNHVCKHGGKRMFLVAEGSEESVKVITGENIASFNTDLEGYTVKVNGIVEALIIDEEYLLEWENELAAEMEHEKGEAEHDGGEHAKGEAEGEEEGHEESSKGEAADMGEHISGYEKIANFRKEIAESGKDHLAFYSIVCEKFEKVETIEE